MVILYRYPDGSLSGCASMRHARVSDVLKPGAAGVFGGMESTEENRKRSARRAAVEMRRKIRNGDLRRLLTFTNGSRDGWKNHREALLQVLDWYENHGGRELLKGSPLVVVPERGKNRRKRLHVHGAMKSGYRLDYGAIIRSWSAYMTAQGYISTAQYHRWHVGDEEGRGKVALSSARVCADYMAKYLGKDFIEDTERLLNEKRYRCKGVCAPEPRRLFGMTLDEVPEMLAGTFGSRLEVCGWFEGEDSTYGGWFIEVGAPSG